MYKSNLFLFLKQTKVRMVCRVRIPSEVVTFAVVHSLKYVYPSILFRLNQRLTTVQAGFASLGWQPV